MYSNVAHCSSNPKVPRSKAGSSILGQENGTEEVISCHIPHAFYELEGPLGHANSWDYATLEIYMATRCVLCELTYILIHE